MDIASDLVPKTCVPGDPATPGARELFAAVDHLVDVRGCPACPSGHLCTRDVDVQPAG